MTSNKIPVINAFRDKDAGVWCASSEDIDGVAMEGDTKEKLISEVKLGIPDLMRANDSDFISAERVLIKFKSEGEVLVRLYA